MITNKLVAWSRAVIARDGRCIDCGDAGELYACHVIGRKEAPDRYFDESNGVSVCRRCQIKRYDKKRPVKDKTKSVYHRYANTSRKELKKRIEELEALLGLLAR